MVEHSVRLPHEGQNAPGPLIKESTIPADRGNRRRVENGGEHGSRWMISLHQVEDAV